MSVKGGAVDEIHELRRKVFDMDRQRGDLMDRIEQMRVTMEEMRREKFTVSAILMRYPGLDYTLRITHTYQTPSGQVLVVAPLTAVNPEAKP